VLEEGPDDAAAGVVHQHVDPAEGGDRLLDQGLDVALTERSPA
jgi:hypothetical protein